jgi:folate-binding protein YgfZ
MTHTGEDVRISILRMTMTETIERGAGWTSRRARGRVRLTGRDARAFLHALTSNDIVRLQPGEGCYATYLTPQGRMIADLRVYCRGDEVILDVAPGIAGALVSKLDLLIFSEEVRVTDESRALGQIGVMGGAAAEVLARASGTDALSLAALDTWSHVSAGDAWIARTDDAPVPSFDVFTPAAGYDTMVARLEEAGAVPLAGEVVEALRIEAGRPAFGVDMTTETIPLEAGLEGRAISTTKGCYVGQEVIIRILHRGGGRVAKRLVRLVFDEDVRDLPESGAPILLDGRDAGRITSAALSPLRDRVVALGYVQREDAEVGRRVTVADAEAEIVGFAG